MKNLETTQLGANLLEEAEQLGEALITDNLFLKRYENKPFKEKSPTKTGDVLRFQVDGVDCTIICAKPDFSALQSLGRKFSLALVNLTDYRRWDEVRQQDIANLLQVLNCGASIYAWYNSCNLLKIYAELFHKRVLKQELDLKDIITWKKTGKEIYPTDSENYLSANVMHALFLTKQAGEAPYVDDYANIRNYLRGAWDMSGMTIKNVMQITGNSSSPNFFRNTQWLFPDEKSYLALQARHPHAFRKSYRELKSLKDAAAKRRNERVEAHQAKAKTYFAVSEARHLTNVFDFPAGFEDFPPFLCMQLIKTSCKESESVVTQLAKKGSDIIAAIKAGRKPVKLVEEAECCGFILERVARFFNIDMPVWVSRNGKVNKRVIRGHKY